MIIVLAVTAHDMAIMYLFRSRLLLSVDSKPVCNKKLSSLSGLAYCRSIPVVDSFNSNKA